MNENPLLVAAGRFHGHIGPFLAIGLRMGLLAVEKLGRSPLGMAAVVAVLPKPPRSCTVDGIQFTTGCTLGKCNIEIESDTDNISARFSTKSDSLVIRLRDDFLKHMEDQLRPLPEKGIIDYAFEIMDTRSEEMFEVSE